MSVDLRGKRFDPLKPRPRFFSDSLWAFLLEPLPGQRTRLIMSGYWAFEPKRLQRLFGLLFLEPSTWIMQTRQFAGIKRRAERQAREAWLLTAAGDTR